MTVSALKMTYADAKRALVVGLGLTGLSCARHLVARGYDVTVADTRAQPPKLAELRAEFPGLAVHTGALDPRLFRDPGLLVVSPGLSVNSGPVGEAVARGAQPIGDIELFARAVHGRTSAAGDRMSGAAEARAPVLAVTGSNGKSTVTALLGAICRQAGLDCAVGGNIGVPALELLRRPEPQVYVLELSSFQLETTYSLDARAATVLNLSADHMDRYDDMAQYARAKARIFAGRGTQVLNADDPLVAAMALPGRAAVRFSLAAPATADAYGVITSDGRRMLVRGDTVLIAADEVPLPGAHNLANVLAAMALADAFSVPRDAQREAIKNFSGLPHRTEIVAEHGGVRWINDSKGTNVGATLAALSGMDAPVILIAGGEGKGQNFSPLRAAVAEKARAVIVFGRDAGLIEAAIARAAPVSRARDLAHAVQLAKSAARPGDVVLLSPACASFDMFRNYEHRGEVFRALVKEVIA